MLRSIERKAAQLSTSGHDFQQISVFALCRALRCPNKLFEAAPTSNLPTLPDILMQDAPLRSAERSKPCLYNLPRHFL